MRSRYQQICLATGICVILVSCFSNDSPTEPIDKLQGRWVASGDEGTTVEHWKMGTGTTLLEGKSYQINGADSLLTETLEIATTDSGIFYIATVQGQNNSLPVSFKLIPSKTDQLIFENPAHDFPKRLTYTFAGTDSLKVDVEGESRSFTLWFNRN